MEATIFRPTALKKLFLIHNCTEINISYLCLNHWYCVTSKNPIIMNTLEKLGKEYINKLKLELEDLEKRPITSGLSGIANLQNNMSVVEGDVKKIAEKINANFVREINSEEIEKSFSDQMRLDCYNLFRKECTQIVSEFSKKFIS